MQHRVLGSRRFVIVLVWLATALGCGANSEDSSSSESLEEMLAQMRAAADAQCRVLETCYPALNEEDDGICWGPTATGSKGWGFSSDEEGEATERACIDRVYAREPEALLEFLDCSLQEYVVIKTCLEEDPCPADITECDDRGEQIEDECKRGVAAKLAPVFGEECGYWDD